jgi:hypothetical protein
MVNKVFFNFVLMNKLIALFFLAVSLNVAAQTTISVDSAGLKLQQFYLSMNAENLWIAGHHINWQTGEADKPGSQQGIKTHCSAFVAAACRQLNIYILRPPQHGQVLLADAQYKWLQSEAARNDGWQPITGNDAYSIYIKAQQLANTGYVVTATWNNPLQNKPGHIALVMPKEITPGKIKESGPVVIMAGTHNYNYISLANGFKHHIKQWPEREILFYYNTHKTN